MYGREADGVDYHCELGIQGKGQSLSTPNIAFPDVFYNCACLNSLITDLSHEYLGIVVSDFLVYG